MLGEAKRDAAALDRLTDGVLQRFGDATPESTTKKRGDEVRQLAWRLWTTQPDFLLLVGPGVRQTYRVTVSPLRLRLLNRLPHASQLGFEQPPAQLLEPPRLTVT